MSGRPAGRLSRRRLSVTVVALTAALAVVAIEIGSSAASPVRPTRFVSPSGADSGSCRHGHPCQSLGYTFGVARAGEVVEVAGGQYGGQSIDGAAKSEPVRFVARRHETPDLRGLDIHTGGVRVEGMRTGFVNIERGGSGGNVSGVTVVGGAGSGFFIGGGTSNVRIVGGTYGGTTDETPIKIQGSPAPYRVTLDRVDIHDAIRTNPQQHMECIYAADVQYLTIRRSRFRNCAIFDLFLTNLSGLDPAHVVLENNVFDATGSHGGSESEGYYSVSLSPNLGLADDYLIRNNSFNQAMTFSAGSNRNVRVVGNVGRQDSCQDGVTYSHNVWSGARCSSTDRQGSPAFIDPSHYDFRSAKGSAAVDHGDPKNSPKVDILGNCRPRGRAPDAGAYEQPARKRKHSCR